MPGESAVRLPDLPQKTNCFRVSFKTTKKNTKKMQEDLVAFDYGLRGKTLWILEALDIFLDDKLNPYRKQQVIECAGFHAFDSQHAILIPEKTWELAWRTGIDAAIFGSETEPPEFIDPSVPLVISAAVNFRILMESGDAA